MASLKRRGAVYGVIGLMLCVAVYLNWSYFQSPDALTIADQAAAETTGTIYGAVTAVDNTKTADAQKKTDEETSKDTKDAKQTDYFAQARLSRETARDEALTMLRETVSSDSASEDAKKQASEKITQIAGNTVKEERLESQLKSKGYADAVVYISDETISVIVSSPKGGLNASSTAAISDMVLSETGAQASMLRVSEAK